ncbi:hypothetical protein HYH03_011892 [Edaphochlamys debaryana]|uniref:Uncharacterized protein n=1 Tax=Edaphochlamys debaryana TaxID=47281 RepID=A0A836BV25_9CHLO|nr:hypothetical protein HYH03_011892 [Edaphochlamys debaryana]|eukprot:KAG2489612.1 hypothetical protein HYH03_011892 [Edaphochlamys debaryana]
MAHIRSWRANALALALALALSAALVNGGEVAASPDAPSGDPPPLREPRPPPRPPGQPKSPPPPVLASPPEEYAPPTATPSPRRPPYSPSPPRHPPRPPLTPRSPPRPPPAPGRPPRAPPSPPRLPSPPRPPPVPRPPRPPPRPANPPRWPPIALPPSHPPLPDLPTFPPEEPVEPPPPSLPPTVPDAPRPPLPAYPPFPPTYPPRPLQPPRPRRPRRRPPPLPPSPPVPPPSPPKPPTPPPAPPPPPPQYTMNFGKCKASLQKAKFGNWEMTRPLHEQTPDSLVLYLHTNNMPAVAKAFGDVYPPNFPITSIYFGYFYSAGVMMWTPQLDKESYRELKPWYSIKLNGQELSSVKDHKNVGLQKNPFSSVYSLKGSLRVQDVVPSDKPYRLEIYKVCDENMPSATWNCSVVPSPQWIFVSKAGHVSWAAWSVSQSLRVNGVWFKDHAWCPVKFAINEP